MGGEGGVDLLRSDGHAPNVATHNEHTHRA